MIYASRNFAGLVSSIVLFSITVIFGFSAIAATPTAYFEDSTAIGSGSTVTLNRVPVQSTTGMIFYWDVTLSFTPGSSGSLTLAQVKIVPSVTLTTRSFKAGLYKGPSNLGNGKFLIQVNGPGVGAGGTTTWSLEAATGADGCTYPLSASWTTAVASDPKNPLYARLKKAGITEPNLSYGVSGGANCGSTGSNNFFNDALLGLSQAGGSLTIFSYSYAGSDFNTPTAQITYDFVK